MLYFVVVMKEIELVIFAVLGLSESQIKGSTSSVGSPEIGAERMKPGRRL